MFILIFNFYKSCQTDNSLTSVYTQTERHTQFNQQPQMKRSEENKQIIVVKKINKKKTKNIIRRWETGVCTECEIHLSSKEDNECVNNVPSTHRTPSQPQASKIIHSTSHTHTHKRVRWERHTKYYSSFQQQCSICSCSPVYRLFRVFFVFVATLDNLCCYQPADAACRAALLQPHDEGLEKTTCSSFSQQLPALAPLRFFLKGGYGALWGS